MAFNWTCPYCSRPQTVTDNNVRTVNGHFYTVRPSIGNIGISVTSIVCSNPECERPTVNASILPSVRSTTLADYLDVNKPLFSKRLLPENSSRPQPDFIPAAIREDYYEACAIRDLSPKASATLSRRCIQGMIRDFTGISKGRLIDEINELRQTVVEGAAPKGVSEESVEAIDSVRKLGNIGAHMEKDIDLIVSIDPNEAQILIELIESLFEEWYVARQKREERFAKLKQFEAQKEVEKGAQGAFPKA